MMGYITSVVQQQMSNRNNLYFDIDVKTNPNTETNTDNGKFSIKNTRFLVKLTGLSLRNLELLFTIQILIQVEKTLRVIAIYLCK